ncbi:MAG: hypothetical protein IPO02_10890 [Bacteroidetes bacterium]|nr:hypothetical protein [Bacteroidota bacterium]
MKKIIRLTVLTLFTCTSLFLTNNKAFGQSDSIQFKPFNVAVSKFIVNDYKEWRRIYDEDSTIRKSNGMNAIAVANSIFNSNTVITAYVINDVEKVKAYVGSNEFQEKAKKSGVTNHQTFDFIQVIRFNPPKSHLDFLEYAIKVKDFDQWLKAYDTEVASQRLEYGLIDEVVARGIDDKNLVHLVYLISDVEKAKQMMSSKKIKKRMLKQGVTEMPTFEYYTR